MRKTFSGGPWSQKIKELDGMVETINLQNCKSYLEIGSRHGDTFYEVMKSLPKGSKGLAVDLPEGPWGQNKSAESLKKCIGALKSEGYNVDVIFGNSRDTNIIESVIKFSLTYDAILIDGDHRLKGSTADWNNYKPLANKLVIFHDIDGTGMAQKSKPKYTVEVPILWNELKTQYKHLEIIDKVENPNLNMGIGILFV